MGTDFLCFLAMCRESMAGFRCQLKEVDVSGLYVFLSVMVFPVVYFCICIWVSHCICIWHHGLGAGMAYGK